jgi:hypothetical protein
MNSQDSLRKTGAGIYVLGILGTFLIMAFLVSLMHSSTQPAPLNQARSEERLKNLTDFRAANEPLLSEYAWQDQSKGIVRIPVDRAMELFLQEWQDPAAGHSNMILRAKKAFAAPPKVAPPKNPFE